jgi:hypothetical protein
VFGRPGLQKFAGAEWVVRYRFCDAQMDAKLVALVETHGAEGNWGIIGAQMPGRNARQCRER